MGGLQNFVQGSTTTSLTDARASTKAQALQELNDWTTRVRSVTSEWIPKDFCIQKPIENIHIEVDTDI